MAKKRRASRARRVYTRAKRVGRRAKSFGGINLKELLFGAALLTAGKIAVGYIAPTMPFGRQAGAVAGGAIASLTGMPGKKLISYGLMDAGSDVLAGFVGGKGIASVSGRFDL